MATVEVVLKDIGTVVLVEGFAAVAGSIRVDSSSIWTPTSVPDLPKSDLNAISGRLVDHGKEKGRVLYARHVPYPPAESVVVAAFCLHIDTGVARITHVARCTTAFVPLQIEYATAQLIHCMKLVAGKHGCSCVEWVHSSQQAAKACCKSYSFRNVARKGRRYEGLRKNQFLVEFRL